MKVKCKCGKVNRIWKKPKTGPKLALRVFRPCKRCGSSVKFDLR